MSDLEYKTQNQEEEVNKRGFLLLLLLLVLPLLLLLLLLLLLSSSSSVNEKMVEKFNNQGVHDKFYLDDQTTKGWICWSYDVYMAERKNIYRILVGKHEGKRPTLSLNDKVKINLKAVPLEGVE
jgi:hypothetical protein